jgi:hexosaminidase
MTILNLAVIKNKADGKEIKSLTSFNPRYSDPGVKGLTDGVFGGRHFNSGWLGYEGEDMVVVIDLGKKEPVHKVSMNFLRDFVSWIFLPDEVKIELSDDGIAYTKAASVSNVITDRRFGVEPVYHNLVFEPQKTRYVKITAKSMKKCPDWHRGAGMPSWIFCDEIIVE